MKKFTFNPFLIVALLLLSFGLQAQNALWNRVSNTETQNRQKTFRKTMPQDFNLFSLNTSALKNQLAQAPARFSGLSDVVIELPTNNGDLQRFRVYEASAMEPALQAQHPNIRSYVAQGIEDGSAVARFSIGTDGVHVMISSVNYSTIYVDPYTQDRNYYISYNRNTLPADTDPFVCMVEEEIGPQPMVEQRNADDGMLRTFRLALA